MNYYFNQQYIPKLSNYIGLTSFQIQQLQNISSTITSFAWGFLGLLDQDVSVGADPSFSSITTGEIKSGASEIDCTDLKMTNLYVDFLHPNDEKVIDFGDVQTGNLTVIGDLYVEGKTVTVDAETVQVTDNLIVLNHGELGAGVTAGDAGIQVDRGSLDDYQFVFDEKTDTFRVGQIGVLQPVATREDTPTNNAIPTWDSTTNSFLTTDGWTIDSGVMRDTTATGAVRCTKYYADSADGAILYTDQTSNTSNFRMLPNYGVYGTIFQFGDTVANNTYSNLTISRYGSLSSTLKSFKIYADDSTFNGNLAFTGNLNTITADEFKYLDGLDQYLTSTSDVKFNTVTLSAGALTNDHTALTNLNAGTYSDGGHSNLSTFFASLIDPPPSADSDWQKRGNIWLNQSTNNMFLCYDDTKDDAHWWHVGSDQKLYSTSDVDFASVSASLISAKDSNSNWMFRSSEPASMTSGAAFNICVGDGFTAITDGDYNIGVGAGVLDSLTSGVGNIGIGNASLSKITTTTNNIGIGRSALRYAVGAGNTAIGFASFAGADTTNTCDYCTGLGYYAGGAITSGDHNTCLGYLAGAVSGKEITSGAYNICIGSNSRQTAGTQNYDIVVGYNCEATAANGIYIGNTTNYTSCTIGSTALDTTKLGYLTLDTSSLTAEKKITFDDSKTSFPDAVAVTGNITATGYIRGSAAGQLLNTYSTNSAGTVYITSTSEQYVLTVNYTPVSSSSKIYVYFHSVYSLPTSSSTWESRLYHGSTLFYTNEQSSLIPSTPLFPIYGVYNNSSTSLVAISVRVCQTYGSQTLSLFEDNSLFEIREFAR